MTSGPVGVPASEAKTLLVDVQLPIDASVLQYSAYLREASGREGSIAWLETSLPRAELVVPDLPGASYEVRVVTSAHGSIFSTEAKACSDGGTVRVSAVAGPLALDPPDGTTDVTPGTEFFWQPTDHAANYMVAYTDDYTLMYHVVSAGDSAHLPDVSALGVPFPRNRQLNWQVYAQAGASSIDDCGIAAPATGGGFSEVRTVTTVP